MSSKPYLISEPLYQYVLSISGEEPAVLRQLREETAQLPNATMQISPDQGRLFAVLIRLMNVKRALEVGVFTGYSSLSVALQLPADGKLVACDVSEEFTAVARRYWKQAGVEDKIELRLAPGVETLDRLLAEGWADQFDFAFIDADKPSYPQYYEQVLKLVRPNGLIAIDNVLQKGDAADPNPAREYAQILRALNAKIAVDPRVLTCVLPMADGITLAVKNPGVG